MKFTKMHGAGNDYIYADARTVQRDWSTLSTMISDRHKGVGSDGLILVLNSEKADLRMQMFNIDGSEGEMCGNGIRCFVRYAIDNEMLPANMSPISVETLAGVMQVTPVWNKNKIVGARVGMNEAILLPEKIPVNVSAENAVIDYPLKVDHHTFNITCVSMGNPHAIAFIEEPVDTIPLQEVGPLVEHHPIFPNRTNFEIVNIVDASNLKVRVWERGSGLTLACGTGACAVAVAARLKGYIGDQVTISLPGGELKVHFPGQGEVVLEGPVATVFEGEWPD